MNFASPDTASDSGDYSIYSSSYSLPSVEHKDFLDVTNFSTNDDINTESLSKEDLHHWVTVFHPQFAELNEDTTPVNESFDDTLSVLHHYTTVSLLKNNINDPNLLEADISDLSKDHSVRTSWVSRLFNNFCFQKLSSVPFSKRLPFFLSSIHSFITAHRILSQNIESKKQLTRDNKPVFLPESLLIQAFQHVICHALNTRDLYPPPSFSTRYSSTMNLAVVSQHFLFSFLQGLIISIKGTSSTLMNFIQVVCNFNDPSLVSKRVVNLLDLAAKKTVLTTNSLTSSAFVGFSNVNSVILRCTDPFTIPKGLEFLPGNISHLELLPDPSVMTYGYVIDDVTTDDLLNDEFALDEVIDGPLSIINSLPFNNLNSLSMGYYDNYYCHFQHLPLLESLTIQTMISADLRHLRNLVRLKIEFVVGVEDDEFTIDLSECKKLEFLFADFRKSWHTCTIDITNNRRLRELYLCRHCIVQINDVSHSDCLYPLLTDVGVDQTDLILPF
ncbi:hypothetical protein GEMRC1_009772 [Eukaryota sp. GEM-RC1]